MSLCFDEVGREIEVLDVTVIDNDILIMAENPIFSEHVSYGDRIRVKVEKDIYYYVETLQKSELVRHSWLLSKEVSESSEIEQIKEAISRMEGRYEQVFGGVLVINVPKDAERAIVSEVNATIEKIDRGGLK
ncbi:DUF4265 domain-containing protein [Paenibacillus glycinis]|uniref:DUF4265 domain-containing protein n=1 Tax=Paenibacillus glycinis TaxID=2697035 RepID=A0ABW9XSE3_9BACL|nr:DUF4265 domain-containing protein [Paenibacillus glycinis]NBD25398.1 DUF4265 domain-containing protein [Paenibacillus glycinis]